MELGITVTGTGSAYGTHDVCTISLGAEVQARTPQDALARVSYAATRMREALLNGGVDLTSLATGAVALQTLHDPWPTVSGYSASVAITARVHDLDAVGGLLTAAVEAGGDAARVHQVSFSHSDPAALRDAARTAAFEDARSSATRYADLAERRLGEVLAVEEGYGASTPVPRMVAASPAMKDMTFDAGDGPVSVSVTVRFGLL